MFVKGYLLLFCHFILESQGIQVVPTCNIHQSECEIFLNLRAYEIPNFSGDQENTALHKDASCSNQHGRKGDFPFIHSKGKTNKIHVTPLLPYIPRSLTENHLITSYLCHCEY